MKIGILLETSSSNGGSFSNSINTIIDLLKNIKNIDSIIVYTHLTENYKILKKLNIPCKLFKYNLWDKILRTLSKFRIVKFFFLYFKLELSVEIFFIKEKTDLIYFPTLSNTLYFLKKVRFIATILDLVHLNYSSFPEISYKEYKLREDLHNCVARNSFLIITSCQTLKDQISERYKISSDKIIIIPYLPCKLFRKSILNNNFYKKKYEKFNKYIFYPAQIWSHKNHITILKANKILKKNKINVQFIFSGKDRGYKINLEKYISKNRLDNVFFAGFVSPDEMDFLYRNSSAVIFTSLVGPDAIPPLEAWKYKKPLIYNAKNLDYVSKNNAIVTDIQNPKLVAKMVSKVLNNNYNNKLIINGTKTLKLINKQVKSGYKSLEHKINKNFLHIINREDSEN
jgi:glycosyltransferase involved in cell wall biosynthesis